MNYSLTDVLIAINCNVKSRSNALKRFRKHGIVFWKDKPKNGRGRETYYCTESDYHRIIELEKKRISKQKKYDVTKQPEPKKVNTYEHIGSGTSNEVNENRKSGYYTRITGYWRMRTEQGVR